MVSDFTQAAGVTAPNPIEFTAGGTFHRTGAGAVAVVVPEGQAADLRRERARRGSDAGSGRPRRWSWVEDLTNNSSITLEGSGSAIVNLAGPALVNAGTLSVLAGGPREIGNGSVTNTGHVGHRRRI